MSEYRARVAVSGGAGFIGSHTVELLSQRGADVLVLDDLSHACGVDAPPGVQLMVADVSSDAAATTLREFRPSAVLHLATKGGVARSLRDPAAHLRVSVASSVAFFSAAIAAGAQSIVAASSGGTIYGSTDHLPADESQPARPVSPYGAAKAAEELYLQAFAKLHGIRALSLRYGNVYGPRQDGTGEAGLVALTAVRLLKGETPVIYGDGRQTRDFVYVEDVARANVAALDGDAGGAINIGTGRETSVLEMVGSLMRIAGSSAKPVFEPGRPGEVRRVALDPGLAGEQLRWRPEIDVRQGVEATFQHFRGRVWAAGR